VGARAISKDKKGRGMSVTAFTLRVDENLLRQVKHRAVDAHMSQNEYVVHLLEIATDVRFPGKPTPAPE
jgi:predicted HicB family RNase H-like nuclease|tara:strand:+ start:135 stop:341 length:207 start_codon:yes stop_codon:yes gene_type:complete